MSRAEVTCYTDGSSLIKDGIRYVEAAVITEDEVIWMEVLPPGTSTQRAKLTALTRALQLGKGEKLTVYTNSWYAFATIHVHGAIYKERELLTAEGKTIKNKREILDLL